MAKKFSTLQEWMDAHGLKDREASERLGISRSQVSRLRRAKSRPTIENARLLEAKTGIPAAVLVMGA